MSKLKNINLINVHLISITNTYCLLDVISIISLQTILACFLAAYGYLCQFIAIGFKIQRAKLVHADLELGGLQSAQFILVIHSYHGTHLNLQFGNTVTENGLADQHTVGTVGIAAMAIGGTFNRRVALRYDALLVRRALTNDKPVERFKIIKSDFKYSVLFYRRTNSHSFVGSFLVPDYWQATIDLIDFTN